MFSKNVKSNFTYCKDFNFSSLHSMNYVDGTRLCYSYANNYRLYLVYFSGHFKFIPCHYYEHQCNIRKLDSRLDCVDLNCYLESEDYFINFMKKSLFIQFPEAEISFYNNLPSRDLVISELFKNPSSLELEEKCYTFFTEDRMNIFDFDGIIYIDVDGGRLRIPYKKLDGNKFLMDMEYCIYQPDNFLENLWLKFWNTVDILTSKLRFDDFFIFIRNFINSKIK